MVAAVQFSSKRVLFSERMLRESGVGGGVMLRCSQPGDEREVMMSLRPHRAPQPDDKLSKRWYILVIVLLYIGLIISFCLNLALLMRKHPPVHQLTTFSTANVEGQLLTIQWSEALIVNGCVV